MPSRENRQCKGPEDDACLRCLNLKKEARSSPCGTAETNLTKNHEVAGLIPGLTQWVKDPVLP